MVLEADRSHHICNHSPGNAGRTVSPRRISCAGSYGRVGLGGYDMPGDTIWLLGSTYLLSQTVELELNHRGHAHGYESASTHHVRQPVRTLGNLALVRFGRPCEGFSDGLETMTAGCYCHENTDAWQAAEESRCVHSGRIDFIKA